MVDANNALVPAASRLVGPQPYDSAGDSGALPPSRGLGTKSPSQGGRVGEILSGHGCGAAARAPASAPAEPSESDSTVHTKRDPTTAGPRITQSAGRRGRYASYRTSTGT